MIVKDMQTRPSSYKSFFSVTYGKCSATGLGGVGTKEKEFHIVLGCFGAPSWNIQIQTQTQIQ